MRHLACLLVLTGLALSCNGSSSGGADPASLERACTALATSQCEQQKSCDPKMFDRLHADMDSCVARTKLTCPIIASANGSGYKASSIEACAKALASANCADIANNVGPAECRIRGALPVGSVCLYDAQCAGAENFCRLGNGCGVCSARKPVSALSVYDDCANNEGCQDGLVCNLGSCVAPVAGENAACSLGQPCQAPYACDNKKCIAATLGVGAACDIYGEACDITQGLRCVDNVCTVMPTAQLGETCGLKGNLVTFCVGGTVCDVVRGQYLGTCRLPLADGEACDDQPRIYDICQPPARCTDGFCNLPEPLLCVPPDAGRG